MAGDVASSLGVLELVFSEEIFVEDVMISTVVVTSLVEVVNVLMAEKLSDNVVVVLIKLFETGANDDALVVNVEAVELLIEIIVLGLVLGLMVTFVVALVVTRLLLRPVL